MKGTSQLLVVKEIPLATLVVESTLTTLGLVAQWLEHLSRLWDVLGSIPSWFTYFPHVPLRSLGCFQHLSPLGHKNHSGLPKLNTFALSMPVYTGHTGMLQHARLQAC